MPARAGMLGEGTRIDHLFARVGAPLVFVLLWSSAFVAIRAGLPDVSPLFFLMLRFAIAFVALFAVLVGLGKSWDELRGYWRHLAIAGLLMNALYLAGAYIAVERTSAATMALIGALHPVMTATLACWLLSEPLRASQWIGLTLGLVGVTMTVGTTAAASVKDLSGALLGFAGVVSLALGTVYFRQHCTGAPLLMANLVQVGAATVACALLVTLAEPVRVRWTLSMMLALLYLGLVVSLVGMALLLFMLQRGTAGQVGSNFYLTPGLTALLAWTILGETVPLRALVGFVVTCLGVWLAQRTPGLGGGS